ncbi:DUF2608 domain-containing protein [Candidatus Paracaedibacter symbiosus]|uniref:DUF2608 domain-containing protein n=1 Tax=Candidatus Paracaedibacter symbiosus TaxID=244582 RepID=UPI0018DD8AA6|nr:DUF2608 domain-containing protein [Candidatus Paracaedibacter symbiosus]
MYPIINKFSSLHSFLDDPKIETLFIFDVDYVLIICQDKVFWPFGAEVALKFRKLFMDPLPKDHSEKLSSIILKNAKIQIMDKSLTSIFSEILTKNAKCIALTACDVGRRGEIEKLEDWRCNQLDKLGFTFDHSFPQHSRIVLNKLPQREYSYPVFQKGIIFSTDYSKGEALGAFLDFVNYHPDRIVFIDDRLENLESVASEAKARGINYHGFHFRKAYSLFGSLDEKIVELQYKHLISKLRWLSEAEAEKLLASKNFDFA